MINFFEESKLIQKQLVDYRRFLHMHPELDRNLFTTSNYVEQILKDNHIIYKRFNNCGIVAEIGFGNKIVALRADMDALTVEDKKDKPYKSLNSGIMHACGHDAHTSILLGAAILLKKHESDLKGKIRLIFQPAEETDGGAKDMIEYGVLEGVSCIIGLHVEETLNTGTIGIKHGVVNAASNPFELIIYGKGAHGAHPEDGIDPIVIGSNLINNLQTIISREISPLSSAVISIGTFNAGTAQNAIAEFAKITGIIRTLGKETREFVIKRFKEIVDNTIKMYSGTYNLSIIDGYPSFNNDNNLINLLYDISDNYTNYYKLQQIEFPSMGVEDFAYYTQYVPGLYYKLGCRNEEKGIIHPAHGSYFDIDEECLWIGCGLQTTLAYKLLEK